jgi:hypothetical protein
MCRNRIGCGSASFSARQNGFNQKCRSNCSEFEGQIAERYKSLDRRNYSNFNYSGKVNALRSVSREHVNLLARIVSQLGDYQICDASRTGASQTEIDDFTAQIRKRINELKSITGV